MPPINNYRDLIVWQKSMVFVRMVYEVSRGFPSDERFGLTSQLRRSAVSIPSNIAEGQGRGTASDYVRFLHVARGSLHEAQTQIEVAQMLEFIEASQLPEMLNLANEIEKMLNSLITKLSPPRQTPQT